MNSFLPSYCYILKNNNKSYGVNIVYKVFMKKATGGTTELKFRNKLFS